MNQELRLKVATRIAAGMAANSWIAKSCDGATGPSGESVPKFIVMRSLEWADFLIAQTVGGSDESTG